MRRLLICVSAVASLPSVALAHDEYAPPPSRMEVFIEHNGISLGALLAVAALGLLAGARGREVLRMAAPVFGVCWLVGGLAGSWGLPVAMSVMSANIATAGTLMLLGVMVAMDRTLPRRVFAVIGGLTGLVHGAVNAREIVHPGMVQVLCIAGAAVTLATCIGWLAMRAKAAWMRIVVRVAGSWIAAIGLLVLGWAIRPAGGG